MRAAACFILGVSGMAKYCICLFISFLLLFAAAVAGGHAHAHKPSHRPAVLDNGGSGGGFWKRFGNEHKTGVPAWAEDCKTPSFGKASPAWVRKCFPRVLAPFLGKEPGKGIAPKAAGGGRLCLQPVSTPVRTAHPSNPMLAPSRCQ